jgi:hypothetical protein
VGEDGKCLPEGIKRERVCVGEEGKRRARTSRAASEEERERGGKGSCRACGCSGGRSCRGPSVAADGGGEDSEGARGIRGESSGRHVADVAHQAARARSVSETWARSLLLGFDLRAPVATVFFLLLFTVHLPRARSCG